MQKVIFIKISLGLLFMVFFSCDKEEKLEAKETYDQKPIDFSFADSIAGVYIGDAYIAYSPSPSDIDTVNLIINVIDYRTDYECKFYIDYLQDTVLLYTNGHFFEPGKTEFNPYHVNIYETKYFGTNKFVMKTTVSSKQGSYTSFFYEGIRQ